MHLFCESPTVSVHRNFVTIVELHRADFLERTLHGMHLVIQ